jgi:hypothetical protein
MSIFSDLNKTFESPFNVSTDDYEYHKLSELEQDKEYKVVNCFINPKSKFGVHGVFGVMGSEGELFNVSLPKHLNDIIMTILDNKDMITEINNGNCKFTIRECNSKKYNRVFYTIDFIE